MIRENIRAEYSGRLIFGWVFIFLFFIIYNVFSKVGIIPKIFGGFYTFSILSSSVLLGGLFFRHIILSIQSFATKRAGIVETVNMFFLMFLLLFFFKVIVGYFSNENLDVVEPLAAAVLRFFCLYIICIYLPTNKLVFYKVNFLSFIAASFVLLAFFVIGGNDFVISDAWQSADRELDYQGTALAYALLTVFGVSYIKKTGIRFLCWVLSFSLLFLIDARSEFILVLVVFLWLEFFLNKSRVMGWIWGFQFVVLTALIATFLFLTGYELEFNTRMGGLVNISEDESMVARDYLNSLGYQTIQDNFIFGDFASYPPGQYMHNIFSAWVDLGFAGFFLLILIFLLCAVVGIFSRVTEGRAIILSLFASCVILLIFTKAYFYILLPVVLGLFVGAYSKKDI